MRLVRGRQALSRIDREILSEASIRPQRGQWTVGYIFIFLLRGVVKGKNIFDSSLHLP